MKKLFILFMEFILYIGSISAVFPPETYCRVNRYPGYYDVSMFVRERVPLTRKQIKSGRYSLYRYLSINFYRVKDGDPMLSNLIYNCDVMDFQSFVRTSPRR